MPELPGQVTTGVGFETGLYTTIELKILPRAVLFQRARQQQIPQCSLNSFVSPSKPLFCSTKHGNSELHQGMYSILLKIVISAAVLFLMFFCIGKYQCLQDKLHPVSSMFLKQYCLFFKGALQFALAMAHLDNNFGCLSHSANCV